MPLGLTVALALAGQAVPGAAAAPAPPPPAAAAAAAAPNPVATEVCRPTPPDPASREIVICAERPNGFRIDPDILTAQRLKRRGGRPVRPGPGGTVRDTSACVVGPYGCPSFGINLMGAALTAAEMAARLARGEGIGSMFITDPQPSEYQLYVAAKREREAAAAAKAAKAKAKAKAAQAAK